MPSIIIKLTICIGQRINKAKQLQNKLYLFYHAAIQEWKLNKGQNITCLLQISYSHLYEISSKTSPI